MLLTLSSDIKDPRENQELKKMESYIKFIKN